MKHNWTKYQVAFHYCNMVAREYEHYRNSGKPAGEFHKWFMDFVYVRDATWFQEINIKELLE